MDTNALLDAAKVATGCRSDYALAKVLQINSGLIARLRKGERQPDAYACGRLAEVLGKDALELIAQVEAENEKNPIRREWWTRFLSSLPRSGVMIVCGLLSLAGFSPTGPVRGAAADMLNVRLRPMRPLPI